MWVFLNFHHLLHLPFLSQSFSFCDSCHFSVFALPDVTSAVLTDFIISILNQLQLLCSFEPSGFCTISPTHLYPDCKLFANCTAGCHGNSLGCGASHRCSCLGLTPWRAQRFLFLVSWKTLGHLCVYLFPMANQSGRFVSTWRASFLLLPTTHTHTDTHICIQTCVIYCMYCNYVAACTYAEGHMWCVYITMRHICKHLLLTYALLMNTHLIILFSANLLQKWWGRKQSKKNRIDIIW